MHLSSFLGSLSKHQHASCEPVQPSPPSSSLVRLDPKPLHNSCSGLVYCLWSLLCFHDSTFCLSLPDFPESGRTVCESLCRWTWCGPPLTLHSCFPTSGLKASPSHLQHLWCGVCWSLRMLHWSLSSLSFRGYQFLSIPVLEFHGKLKCDVSISYDTTLSVRRLRSEGQGAILVVF